MAVETVKQRGRHPRKAQCCVLVRQSVRIRPLAHPHTPQEE